jgi:hypothetical protein
LHFEVLVTTEKCQNLHLNGDVVVDVVVVVVVVAVFFKCTSENDKEARDTRTKQEQLAFFFEVPQS